MSSIRPVKTYVRRKTRNRESQTYQSSPLKDPGSDVPRSEMGHRMLKRSRSAMGQSLSDLRSDRNSNAPVEHEKFARKSKKPKHMQDTLQCEGTQDNVMLNVYDTTVLRTPLTTDAPVYSPVIQCSPDHMSPVPIARRIISRSSSRNSKENIPRRRGPRNLASPFHSRPNSTTTSPRNPMNRPQRASRNSRTLSRASNGNLRRDPKPKQLITSGEKSLCVVPGHQRHDSLPGPLQNFQQVAQADWLARPKISNHRSPFSGDTQQLAPLDFAVGNSSFFNEMPEAYSTPHKRLRLSNVNAAEDFTFTPYISPIMMPDLSPVAVGQGCGLGDFVGSEDREDGYVLSSNSIFSDTTCEFTLHAHTPNLQDPTEPAFDGLLTGLHMTSTGSATFSRPEDDVPFLPPTSSPASIPLGEVRSHSVYGERVDATKFYTPDTMDDTIMTGPTLELNDILTSLALDDDERHANSDSETIHRAPSSNQNGDTGRSTARTRSLDNSSTLPGFRNADAKQKQIESRVQVPHTRARNRAGTIRASDYLPSETNNRTVDDLPLASQTTNGSFARRTRSGTIVGPSFKSAANLNAALPFASLGPSSSDLALSTDAEMDTSDDELLLKPDDSSDKRQLRARLFDMGRRNGQAASKLGSDDELDFFSM